MSHCLKKTHKEALSHLLQCWRLASVLRAADVLVLQTAEPLSISLLECNKSGEFMSKKTDLHGLWDLSKFESSACQGASHA